MNPIRAHARKFLKDNLEGGAEMPRSGGEEILKGWFTTRDIFNGILPYIRPDTEINQLSDTLCVLRRRGEVECRKGANGNPHHGFHRFVRDPKLKICTGNVGMTPRHRDTAHQRELYRLRELAKGRIVREKKAKPPKAPPNPKGTPKRTHLGYSTADILPPPPKPKHETYEQFLARGGKPEILPGFAPTPRHVFCTPVDTRSESQRRGG